VIPLACRDQQGEEAYSCLQAVFGNPERRDSACVSRSANQNGVLLHACRDQRTEAAYSCLQSCSSNQSGVIPPVCHVQPSERRDSIHVSRVSSKPRPSRVAAFLRTANSGNRKRRATCEIDFANSSYDAVKSFLLRRTTHSAALDADSGSGVARFADCVQ